MVSAQKKETLKRLSYIEGHLAGVKRMLEEDKYCVDILKQTFAIRRAIEKVVELNERHQFSFDRETLITMLDAALAK